MAILQQVAPGKADFVPWQGDFAVPASTNLLINSTSIGLYPDTSRVPIRSDTLRPEMVVCDVIPNPPRTRFLTEASGVGCRTLDGLGMLVNQGVVGIRLWTGRDPNPVVMRAALEQIFCD